MRPANDTVAGSPPIWIAGSAGSAPLWADAPFTSAVNGKPNPKANSRIVSPG